MRGERERQVKNFVVLSLVWPKKRPMRVVASARAFLFVKVMQETKKPPFSFFYIIFYNRHTFKVILYNVFWGE